MPPGLPRSNSHTLDPTCDALVLVLEDDTMTPELSEARRSCSEAPTAGRSANVGVERPRQKRGEGEWTISTMDGKRRRKLLLAAFCENARLVFLSSFVGRVSKAAAVRTSSDSVATYTTSPGNATASP